MVEIDWKTAFGCASFASTIAAIATTIIQAVYNDLFSHLEANNALIWLYAFGGIVLVLGMGILAAAIFVDTGSKWKAIEAAIAVAGILLCIFIIWAIIYDAFFTGAFIYYQAWDWFFGIPYVMSYFARGQFGSIPTFWTWGTFFYWALFPVFLKWIGVQKKSKYLKTRVKKDGW